MLANSSSLLLDSDTRLVREAKLCEDGKVTSGFWNLKGKQGETQPLRDIVVLDDVLSQDECAEIIRVAEDRHFTVPPQCESCSDPSTLKNSTRVDIANWDQTVAQIWARIQDYIPHFVLDQDGVEWEFIGLNNFLRIARYEGSQRQQFAKHVDGINKDLGLMKPAAYLGKSFVSPDGGEAQTMLGLHFFLNDGAFDFQGGRMIFYREDEEWISVPPVAGRLVIFRQGQANGLLHCGEMVELRDSQLGTAARSTFGKKYVLRSDAVYRRTA